MSSKDKKIQRLARQVMSGGKAGRRIADEVHETLVDYVRSHDTLELQSDDCPDNNPDCNPPDERDGP